MRSGSPAAARERRACPAGRHDEFRRLVLGKRRCQAGQLADVLIPSLLTPVQPLLLGLGDFTPSHRVHDETDAHRPGAVYLGCW